MTALRREIVRQFSIITGGDQQTRMEQVPFVTKIHDEIVARFQSEGWPLSDAAVIETVRKEVEKYV